MKKSEWQSALKPPISCGVYETKIPSMNMIAYQRWFGDGWGMFFFNLENKGEPWTREPTKYQPESWRGVLP